MKIHVIYIVVIILVAAIAFFGGRKIYPPELPPSLQRDSIIDALENQKKHLIDSFATLDMSDKENVKYITQWVIKYDTIRPKEDVSDIINGLNQVGGYPIPQ